MAKFMNASQQVSGWYSDLMSLWYSYESQLIFKDHTMTGRASVRHLKSSCQRQEFGGHGSGCACTVPYHYIDLELICMTPFTPDMTL